MLILQTAKTIRIESLCIFALTPLGDVVKQELSILASHGAYFNGRLDRPPG
jgi:hypothetical protein